MLSGIEALLAAGHKLLGTVILASAPSKRQAQGIIAVLDEGYVADAAIYLHPAESGAGLRDIKATTSGILCFRITVPGALPDTDEPTHTPFYHLAVNPIDKAWLVYQSLQMLANRRAKEIYHPSLGMAVGRSTNLHIAYIKCGDEQQLSRVSPEAVLAGSVTFPPNEKMIDVQTQIAQAVETAANNDAWLKAHPPKLEWIMGTSGVEVPTDSPLYQTVSQSIQAVTGIEPASHSLHSASDIRNPLLHKGIPTVGFGSLAGNFTQAGNHDEWVDVEDYISMIKVVGSVILNWCGT
jgi:acetylornithine deacetylase